MSIDTATHKPLPKVTPYGAAPKELDSITPRLMSYARRGLRQFGIVTERLRDTPDYLIIGTKRGGTTSLARWVLEHPQVLPMFPARERRKGTYYFDVNYGRGEAWFRSHFPTQVAQSLRSKRAGKKLIVGDSTPYYLYHPHAAVRAKRLVPDAKIMVLLRNPIERAYGHWGERTRQGIETLSFEEALDAEASRIDGEEAKMLDDPSYSSFAHQHYSYVDQGRYSRGLKRWMDAYPPEQLLVIRSEDMYEEPALIYKQVVEHLGIDDYSPEAFAAWNMKQSTIIEPAIRERLAAELAEDIELTEALLGRSMGWQ